MIDLTDAEYSDEPFEYVYYEYYYDYEYEDDIDGSVAALPPAPGHNEEISGPALQQHQPLQLPTLKQQLVEQQHLTRPVTPPAEQDTGAVVGVQDTAAFSPRGLGSRAMADPPQPQTTLRSEAQNTINHDAVEEQTERQPQPKPSSRRPPTPPRPQPPPTFDDSRFPHFQNFKPIDASLDPPVHSLPPPPRRVEQPRSQQSVERERQQQIQRQMEIEKQKQLERQALLEKQRKEIEEEEQRQREKVRRAELEREQQRQREEKDRLKSERKRKEEAERLEQEKKKKLLEEQKRKEEAEKQKALEEKKMLEEPSIKPEVTTFGPFSAFKNFPSFPANVLENQQEALQLTELRGPNLLPTKPTKPTKPTQKSPPPPPPPQGPPAPTRPPPSPAGGDELRFIPSPPLRPAQPPPQVSVFLPADEARPQDPPSVFLSEPARPAPPQQQPPRANFQNTFFAAQTNLGQTQTRIPPSRPQQEPFTFFGGQSSSRPVSFPTQQSASSSSSPFVNFNNFRAPEQPRSLQSVFGGQPQPPPNTFFSQDARFDVHKVFTITEKAPYDLCAGVPILHLLTVG